MARVKWKGLARLVLTGVAALTVGAAFDGCGSSAKPPPGGTGGMECPSTFAKGGTCTSICYEKCGPEGTGVTAETCQGGVYTETAGCTYDGRSYACYQIPSNQSLDCVGEIPTASAACSVAPCIVCNSNGGLVGGQFTDSDGVTKDGFCVCSMDTKKWSCTPTTAWPCPKGNGCTVSGTGGSTGAGGSAQGGSIGSGVAGSTGSGGSIGSGGSVGVAGTTGRGGSTGRGGAGGGSAGAGGGAAGTGGSSGGKGGAGGGFGQPMCPPAVTKGGTCAATDIQLCFKSCGPDKTGVKSETCSAAGVYEEMDGCRFDPNGDYSCYKIETVANTRCPMGTPTASQTCNTATCTACNNNRGAQGGQYFDASGTPQVGYCVCEPANSAGMRVWSCAPEMQWPCPDSSGC